MLVSKNHLLVAKIASKDDSRPILTGVKFYKDADEVVAVATDSYMLVEVRERTPPVTEYPKDQDGREYKAVDSVLVPARTALKLAGNIVKRSVLPILKYALLEPSRITTTDLEDTTSLGFRSIEGNYPDYKKLVPSADEVGRYSVTIDPALLQKTLLLFKGESSIKLTVSAEKLQPVTVYSESDGVKRTAVIMPLKD